MDREKLRRECLEMKLKALELTASTGAAGAHIGGAFSSMELMATLLENLNLFPQNAEERDRLILSKGHGSLALYTALWQKGILTEDELLSFDKNGTEYFAHPHRNISKAIEFSGGSLGLGMSYAVGVALGCKRKGIENRIFAILGDGECDEGIVWEALMSASNFKLDNLTVIVDKNGMQVDGETKEVMDTADMAAKFVAFGFETIEIDGHSFEELERALTLKSDKPMAIIAKTVKANGISFLENTKQSHHCSLTKKKYEQAVNEIKAAYGME